MKGRVEMFFKDKKTNPKSMAPMQGDVIWVDLDQEDTVGHEQQKKRPVLVISNDDYNDYCGGLTKILPITSSSRQNRRKFAFHVRIPDGFEVHGQVMLEQERAIDVTARNYDYCCHLPEDTVEEIIKLLKTSY